MSRLLMILDFLKGEKAAKAILADMIEEDGDEYLSQLVRSRNPTQKKFLQLGLEVIPFSLATQIVIGYFLEVMKIERVFDTFHAAYSDDQYCRLKELVTTVYQGLHDVEDSRFDRDDEEESETIERLELCYHELREIFKTRFREIRQSARGLRKYSVRIEESIQQLLLTFEIAIMIVKAEHHGDRSKAKRSNNRLRSELVMAARMFRHLATTSFNLVGTESIVSEQTHLLWQWNYLVEQVELAVSKSVE